MRQIPSLLATAAAAAAVATLAAGPAHAGSYGVAISSSALASHAGPALCDVNYRYGPNQITCYTPDDAGHVSATASVVTTSTPGAATAATTNVHEDGPALYGGNGTASASTTVDLASASLNMSANASGSLPSGGGGASSSAALSDTLHFSVAGAGTDTHTTIGVTFRIDGTMTTSTADDAAEFYGGLNFGGSSAQFYLRNFGNSTTNPNQTVGSFDEYPSGFDNGVWTSNADYSVNVFTGTYSFSGSTANVSTLLSVNLVCRNAGYGGSVTCDYGSTAISLQLPSDVSFTSDSGVFLRDGATAAPVPEPGTWALMIGGLAAMGGALNRRRRIERGAGTMGRLTA